MNFSCTDDHGKVVEEEGYDFVGMDGCKIRLTQKDLEARLMIVANRLPVLRSVSISGLALSTMRGCASGMTTSELDYLMMETAAYMSAQEPEYDALAARIYVNRMHITLPKRFSEHCLMLYKCTNPSKMVHCPQISEAHMAQIERNAAVFDAMEETSRDYNFTYFALRSMEKTYFKKIDGKPFDLPQRVFLRAAISIHKDIESIRETYDLMSTGFLSHATPTLTNACAPQQQLSSCFVAGTQVRRPGSPRFSS